MPTKTQQSKLETDFKGEVTEQEKTELAPVNEESDEETSAVDKTENGTPYCVKHHCKMVQASGGKAGSPVAYFKCPVKGCKETGKRVKQSRSVIPSEPHTCPRCEKHPVMERDAALSTAMYSILKCPTCGHKSAPMPRPEFVQHHEQARGVMPEPALGAR